MAVSLDSVVTLNLFECDGLALLKTALTSHLLSHGCAFLWRYSNGGWAAVTGITAKLGIASRQEWILASVLMFFICVVGKGKLLIEGNNSVHRPRRAL